MFGNSILDTRAFIVQLGKKQFNSTFFSERSKAHKSICRKEMSFSSVAAFVQNVSNCSPAHWLFPPRAHYDANAISCQLLFSNKRPQFPISLSFFSRGARGAVISFSTRRHGVGGRYLRFRRACGKLGSPRWGSAVSHSRSHSYIILCGEVRVRCQRAGAISLCPGVGGGIVQIFFIYGLAPTTA